MCDTEVTEGVVDRARGALLASACGDALGVPYEFDDAPRDPQMIGGGLGPYEPGEWSDDTQMMVCIARVADSGLRLTSAAACDAVGQNFIDWMRNGATDIGTQTRAVISAATRMTGDVSDRLTTAAREYLERTQRAAGNGALMRTAPVGLCFLWDREQTAHAARLMAELTHADRLVAESCILWSEAIRLAITDEVLDIQAGLDLLLHESRSLWRTAIADAEHGLVDPHTNGYTVSALQCAWYAVHSTREYLGEAAVYSGIRTAVKLGGDTDTIAAIAGALLGARWGEKAIPEQWKADVHGWPGMTGADLANMAERIVRKSKPRGF
ncbi:ADP-ribosylglycohydrolase family protein [Trueperella sp. LYQ143]|uniref:ADP-ribosylglycohydrolase family protein n=1 Tax=unclassified Trueperella TaxID=2630174 RepID=UPI0039835CAE